MDDHSHIFNNVPFLPLQIPSQNNAPCCVLKLHGIDEARLASVSYRRRHAHGRHARKGLTRGLEKEVVWGPLPFSPSSTRPQQQQQQLQQQQQPNPTTMILAPSLPLHDHNNDEQAAGAQKGDDQ